MNKPVEEICHLTDVELQKKREVYVIIMMISGTIVRRIN